MFLSFIIFQKKKKGKKILPHADCHLLFSKKKKKGKKILPHADSITFPFLTVFVNKGINVCLWEL